MFWVKRLKEEEPGLSWELSYADLMSLLMGVFVMITAMSDLRNGEKFRSISEGVRGAFGFGSDGTVAAGLGAIEMTFLDRLRKVGLESDNVAARGTDAAVLAPCDISSEDGRVIIRIARSASFNTDSSRIKNAGRGALLRIAQFLASGKNDIEIRAHGDTAPAGSNTDELELSYQRARAVVDLLTKSGVHRNRLRLTAGGDRSGVNDPMVSGNEDEGRGIEIVLHSIPTAKTKQIAEKEQL